jgi:hypothetical protein
MKNLKITLIAILIATANSFAQNIPQTLKYDFKFDWLSAYKVNLLDASKEDVMSIGYCRLFVKNKTTGKDDQILPTGFSYIGNYGRVYEVSRSGAYEMNNYTAKPIMNSFVRFQFEPIKYGYKTLADLYDNAYFKIVAEVKIKGFNNDEIFGKSESIVFLKDANINFVTKTVASQMRSSAGNGFLFFRKDSRSFGVYYSIKPVN